MLSGGLDSSIVAAGLGQQSTPFSCLTLVTRDASGDERDYARLVTEVLGTTLDARLREVDRIQPERSEAAHLPCPSVRLFAQEWTRIAVDVARSRGAEALFTGGGGDNVFCSLQSAAPAADRLLTSGLGIGFWRAALDVSTLAPASLWAVVTSALKRAWIRGPAYRHRPDIRLLSRCAAQLANSAPPHPWLLPPAGALPGSATHIALLAFAQSFVEGQDPFQVPETVTPLLSQPVVEACLQVPSWLWIEDGHNRVIARQAFAADLPAAIVERRSKGTPDSFSAEIFEANRRKFLELLVDGELARHDMIDVRAVCNVLEDPRPVANDHFHRILQLVDVEAWARAWRGRRIPTVDRVTA
jgi:asparagine synthase (glutamine-hydrolysing)